jgi:hypothetical protein
VEVRVKRRTTLKGPAIVPVEVEICGSGDPKDLWLEDNFEHGEAQVKVIFIFETIQV